MDKRVQTNVPNSLGLSQLHIKWLSLTGPKPKEIKAETFRIDCFIRTPKMEKLSLRPISFLSDMAFCQAWPGTACFFATYLKVVRALLRVGVEGGTQLDVFFVLAYFCHLGHAFD